MFKEEGMDAVLLNHNIDNPFITHLEQANSNVKFLRIDADLDNFKEEVKEDELKDITESLTDIFKKVLDNDKLNIRVDKLKNADISSMLQVAEDSRRMADMMKAYGMGGDFDPSMFGGEGETLVLNANNDLVRYIIDNKEGETTELIVKQLYDLAVLANHPLNADAMTAFVTRSNEILKKLAL